MGLKKNNPGCGCCGCPCDIYTDTDSGNTCCYESITWEITLPDTLYWYRYVRVSPTQNEFYRMTINGWSAINGTHTSDRIGTGGGSDCNWITPADVTTSVSWELETTGPLTSCPDAYTTWTVDSSGTDTGFTFVIDESPDGLESRVLSIKTNNPLFSRDWFVECEKDSGTKVYCGSVDLGVNQVSSGTFGSTPWIPSQKAEFTAGTVITCKAAAVLDDATSNGFEF